MFRESCVVSVLDTWTQICEAGRRARVSYSPEAITNTKKWGNLDSYSFSQPICQQPSQIRPIDCSTLSAEIRQSLITNKTYCWIYLQLSKLTMKQESQEKSTKQLRSKCTLCQICDFLLSLLFLSSSLFSSITIFILYASLELPNTRPGVFAW